MRPGSLVKLAVSYQYGPNDLTGKTGIIVEPGEFLDWIVYFETPGEKHPFTLLGFDQLELQVVEE